MLTVKAPDKEFYGSADDSFLVLHSQLRVLDGVSAYGVGVGRRGRTGLDIDKVIGLDDDCPAHDANVSAGLRAFGQQGLLVLFNRVVGCGWQLGVGDDGGSSVNDCV